MFNIIIPCYNEVTTITQVVHEIIKKLERTKYNYQIFIVDNNSTDGSQKAIINLIKIYHPKVIPLFCIRQGKGNAIIYALNYIKQDNSHIVLHDADLEYSIDSLVKLIDNYDFNKMYMSIGVRSNLKFKSYLANLTIRLLILAKYKRNVPDVLTGMRIVPFSLLKACNSSGFEIETEITCRACEHGIEIKAYDIQYTPRTIGKKIKAIDMLYLIRKFITL